MDVKEVGYECELD